MIRDRLKSALRDKSRERDIRKQERAKLKRRSRKYGQAEEKHSRRGLESCAIGVFAFFLMVLSFSVSYINRGDVNISIGFVGLVALILSWFGLYNGIQGLKERDKNYISCKIGIAGNGLFLLGLFFIFLRGLF